MKTAEEKAHLLREQVNAKIAWGARDREILNWLQERHGMTEREANDFLAGASHAKRAIVRKKAFWPLGFSVAGMLVAGVVGYGSFFIVILGIASFGLFFQSLFRLLTGHTQGFSALWCAGVLWLWFSGFQFRPDELHDFSTITGTLISADEEISTSFRSRSGHLDIRLQESKMRYRVPANGYLDYFRREAFFAEVPKGATVQLTALKSDIAEPGPFWTVFVEGVRVDGRDYCVVQDHIARQRSEKRFRLTLAVVGSAILVVNFVSTRRRQKAAKAREISAA